MKIQVALQHLGLTTTATEADVKQAYRELVKIWHPDRFQNDERLNARTEAQLKLINEAKTVALAYLEKHGHFLRVGEERPRATSGPEAYRRRRPQSPPGNEPGARKKKEPEPEPEEKKESRKESRQESRWKNSRKHKEAEEPVEETPPPPPSPPVASFQFGQNALIVVFIILVLASFSILLFASLGESPMKKMKAYSEQKPVVDPLRMIMAEKDARLGITYEDEDLESEEETPVAEALLDTFFTLGSNKEWVSIVQGPPLQIKGSLWRYGHSTVDFVGDSVAGWNSSVLNPLMIGMILSPDSIYPYSNFTVGSRKDEVVALQGSPSIVKGELWNFGEALVLFQADTVVSYKNDQGNTLYAPTITDPDRLSLITSP